MKKNNNKLLIWLAVITITFIGFAFFAKSKGWIGKTSAKQVAVEEARLNSIVEMVTASGKIQPEMEVKVSSEVSGEIIQLNVKEGDSVKRGDLLLVINPVIYESVVTQSQAGVNQVRANKESALANLSNAQSQLQQAQITFSRNQKLYADKIISDAEFDQAKNALKSAETLVATSKEQMNASGFTINSSEAQLKQARDNLQKTRIYAPVSGIISLCNIKLGERVVGTAQMTGTELIRIADLNNMQAQIDVNENDVLRVKIGDTAEIEVDAYLNKKVLGLVSQIAYSSTTATSVVATSQATNFTVKVKLLRASYRELIDPAHGHKYPFRPGMSTTVDIHTSAKANVLTVPIQSVAMRGESAIYPEKESVKKGEKNFDEKDKSDLKEVVFTITKDNKVKAVEVKTGIQDANNIEILSGISVGEKVVKAPFKMVSKTLKTGDVIEVVKEKDLFKEDVKEK